MKYLAELPLTGDTTTGLPYIASASGEIYPAWGALTCLGSPNSGWYSGSTGPAWLQIDFGSAQTVTGYILFPGNIGSATPNAWTLAGSNNGTTWTTLDSQSGHTTWAAPYPVWTVSSPGGYRYYRLTLTTMNVANYFNLKGLQFEIQASGSSTPKIWTAAGRVL